MWCGRSCRRKVRSTRGSALLTVLWLSAALAAIVLSLSNTVREEVGRTSTELDGLRSYYLAAGGVHRAYMEMLWSTARPDQRLIPRAAPWVVYAFPSGNVHVEIIPETAKLDVNTIRVEDLMRLLLALGVEPARAPEIAAAIDDWRRPGLEIGPFDPYYLAQTPSFRARHASLQEIEDLLLVKGVTPDLFYGTYVPSDAQGGPRLTARPGLIDCLSVFGSREQVDANTASPAVLAAVGLNPYAISALVQRRKVAPLIPEQLAPFLASIGVSPQRLRLEGNTIYTFRATARLRLANGQFSDLKRTVAAQVKYMPVGVDTPVHVLRWYDMAWSN